MVMVAQKTLFQHKMEGRSLFCPIDAILAIHHRHYNTISRARNERSLPKRGTLLRGKATGMYKKAEIHRFALRSGWCSITDVGQWPSTVTLTSFPDLVRVLRRYGETV